jgi:hypothetical protein
VCVVFLFFLISFLNQLVWCYRRRRRQPFSVRRASDPASSSARKICGTAYVGEYFLFSTNYDCFRDFFGDFGEADEFSKFIWSLLAPHTLKEKVKSMILFVLYAAPNLANTAIT